MYFMLLQVIMYYYFYFNAGGFGFLSVEMEDCKRLFFHMSEVRGNRNDLLPGDTVEYVLMTNSRTGKSSACNVVKIRYVYQLDNVF